MSNEQQINVRVPKELAKRAKIKAIEEGRSMQEVLKTMIEDYVQEQQQKKQQKQAN